jgi:bifunctional ADP-heptose synthase (sugar kinase/adenylyltransferase)
MTDDPPEAHERAIAPDGDAARERRTARRQLLGSLLAAVAIAAGAIGAVTAKLGTTSVAALEAEEERRDAARDALEDRRDAAEEAREARREAAEDARERRRGD